jgi:hypothetical protein
MNNVNYYQVANQVAKDILNDYDENNEHVKRALTDFLKNKFNAIYNSGIDEAIRILREKGEGNNIYEGDILSHDKKIGTVYYNADRAGFVLEWEYSRHEQNYVNLTCDVAYESSNIGNIFKNPELLK